MIDLALAIGQPVNVLRHSMTERDLARWVGYIRRRKLPHTRMEAYLAQLTLIVAQSMGGAKDMTMADFIIDFDTREASDVVDDDDIDLDEVKFAFGFNPIKKTAANG